MPRHYWTVRQCVCMDIMQVCQGITGLYGNVYAWTSCKCAKALLDCTAMCMHGHHASVQVCQGITGLYGNVYAWTSCKCAKALLDCTAMCMHGHHASVPRHYWTVRQCVCMDIMQVCQGITGLYGNVYAWTSCKCAKALLDCTAMCMHGHHASVPRHYWTVRQCVCMDIMQVCQGITGLYGNVYAWTSCKCAKALLDCTAMCMHGHHASVLRHYWTVRQCVCMDIMQVC